jgi:hypothetical protein
MSINVARLFILGTTAWGLGVVLPHLPASSQPTSWQAAASSKSFVNSRAQLTGDLADNYSDFSFQYPGNWRLDPVAGKPGAKNFVKVERIMEDEAGRFTQENLAVGWFTGVNESGEGREKKFKELVKIFDDQLKPNFPEYQKVSEGKTTIRAYEGYEFKFSSFVKGTRKGDVYLWGRVVFLPNNDTSGKGVILIMLTSSLAPEIKGVADIGVKGELPVILNSFKLGL